ncbi:MAG: flagellar basal body-associated FliL family protein [Desulfovibrionales bacterium]|nr:flagellar basal body-associated FliL family protein [Desulfovibrionales bacterium]
MGKFFIRGDMSMAEKEKKEAEEVEEAGEEKPKKGKLFSLIIIVVIVLALSAGGYLAYTMYIGPKFIHQEKKAAVAKEKKTEGAEKVGIFLPLDPFIVNLLIDGEGTRYLKMKIDLELEGEDEKVKAEAEKHIPQLRDTIIMLLTSKTYEEVMTLEGKIRLRDEIIIRANHYLGKNKVKGVYFSEFVIQ